MSTSETVSAWNQRAEVDYFPLFFSRWLALDAWMAHNHPGQNDRGKLELLKRGGNPVSDRFNGLLGGTLSDANAASFKSNLAALHRALENANISASHQKYNNKFISFQDCIADWDNGQGDFISVLKTQRQRGKIRIDTDLWVSNDVALIFKAYIEIAYQIRSVLFHGRMAPSEDNERVIRYLYLTLSTVMEDI